MIALIIGIVVLLAILLSIIVFAIKEHEEGTVISIFIGVLWLIFYNIMFGLLVSNYINAIVYFK